MIKNFKTVGELLKFLNTIDPETQLIQTDDRSDIFLSCWTLSVTNKNEVFQNPDFEDSVRRYNPEFHKCVSNSTNILEICSLSD